MTDKAQITVFSNTVAIPEKYIPKADGKTCGVMLVWVLGTSIVERDKKVKLIKRCVKYISHHWFEIKDMRKIKIKMGE